MVLSDCVPNNKDLSVLLFFSLFVFGCVAAVGNNDDGVVVVLGK